MNTRFALLAGRNGQLPTRKDYDEDHLIKLNDSLYTLATVFPRILPEVFREMLQTFDGESGLQTVVEQLLTHQDEWVKGRWRKDTVEIRKGTHLLVSVKDRFRRADYRSTVRRLLCKEFKNVNLSKIDAVLAEENFCYTQARPMLQQVAAKSWRNSFNMLLSRWRKLPETKLKEHYLVIWLSSCEGVEPSPVLKETGDAELDEELHQAVLIPILEQSRREREEKDWEFAMTLNEAEAKHVDAIYECQCCFSDTTFEQMATCTTAGHIICLDCIWHTVSEALFGQGWGRNIDHNRGQIKCVAPVSEESCDGCIPQNISRRAIVQSKGGMEVLAKLESRVAEEALRKARLLLVHCPFCAYVEVDELYFPQGTLRYTLNTSHPSTTVLLLLLMITFIPVLLMYALVLRLPFFTGLPTLTEMATTSLARLSRSRHLSQRFQCRSPLCAISSCLICFKVWRDPHTCHESENLSLRIAVEAARTAALKRTCPRCGLGFIKDSGCNKFTCICGYSMCYICRQGLGRGHGGEGYRHFCQHFRPAAGICKECDKCDLYRNEDDEAMVQRASAAAEKEWREKEGMTGIGGIGGSQEREPRPSWWASDWNLQEFIDWWVAEVIAC